MATSPAERMCHCHLFTGLGQQSSPITARACCTPESRKTVSFTLLHPTHQEPRQSYWSWLPKLPSRKLLVTGRYHQPNGNSRLVSMTGLLYASICQPRIKTRSSVHIRIRPKICPTCPQIQLDGSMAVPNSDFRGGPTFAPAAQSHAPVSRPHVS